MSDCEVLPKELILIMIEINDRNLTNKIMYGLNTLGPLNIRTILVSHGFNMRYEVFRAIYANITSQDYYSRGLKFEFLCYSVAYYGCNINYTVRRFIHHCKSTLNDFIRYDNEEFHGLMSSFISIHRSMNGNTGMISMEDQMQLQLKISHNSIMKGEDVLFVIHDYCFMRIETSCFAGIHPSIIDVVRNIMISDNRYGYDYINHTRLRLLKKYPHLVQVLD